MIGKMAYKISHLRGGEEERVYFENQKKLTANALKSSKMKTYYFKWGKHHTSKYGGQDGQLEVFQVKNGEIVKVGETFVQTRSMKGYESEALDVLYKEGIISKEDYDGDKGYYSWNNGKFKIKELK